MRFPINPQQHEMPRFTMLAKGESPGNPRWLYEQTNEIQSPTKQLAR